MPIDRKRSGRSLRATLKSESSASAEKDTQRAKKKKSALAPARDSSRPSFRLRKPPQEADDGSLEAVECVITDNAGVYHNFTRLDREPKFFGTKFDSLNRVDASEISTTGVSSCGNHLIIMCNVWLKQRVYLLQSKEMVL